MLGLSKTGYLNQQNQKLEIKLTESQKNYEEQCRKVADIEKRYNDLEAVKEQVKKELEEKKKEARGLAKELSQEKQKRRELERKLKRAEHQIESLKVEVKKSKADKEEINARLERMAGRLERQETDKHNLLNRLDNVMKERDTIKKELSQVKDRDHYSLKEITVSEQKQYSGFVLNINEKYQFCVISIGKQDGIAAGVDLIVYRGAKLIGKVKVERVFDKMSSAKIISLQKGEQITEDDSVRKF